MPLHPFGPLRGRIETLDWDSDALAGNLVGDPARRPVHVYLPEGHDDADGDFPLIVELAAFTGSGPKRIAWQAFGESVPQRVERLLAEGRMGPSIVAFPDSFTSLGGNQFVDTPVLGYWSRWLLDEMLPRVEDRFRVRRGAAHRAVLGKSSGGYGALVQGLRHGERWAAVACHSGDLDFDLAYRPDLPSALDTLNEVADGDPAAFVEAVRASDTLPGKWFHALMIVALAGTYDPAPEARLGLRLPVDRRTCALDPDRWAAWLRHDPLRMADDPTCLDSLRRLRLLFLDCGRRDEYRLHYGFRALVDKLEAGGVPHVADEHDGTHAGLDPRYDVSLPRLFEAIG